MGHSGRVHLPASSGRRLSPALIPLGVGLSAIALLLALGRSLELSTFAFPLVVTIGSSVGLRTTEGGPR